MNLRMTSLLGSLLFIGSYLSAINPYSIGQSFYGATIKNVQALLRSQPNANGGVGPEQYILITNDHIRSFNKLTGQPDGILDMDTASFFGFPTADTHIMYDRWGKRWIAVGDIIDYYSCQGLVDFPSIGIVYSDGPIITSCTQWKPYRFANLEIIPPCTVTAPNSGIDSPLLATDQNAAYITVSIFGLNVDQFLFPLVGITLIVIPQSAFEADCLSGLYNIITPVSFGGNPAQSQQSPPANNFDPNPQYGYIINAQNNYNQYPSNMNYTALYLYRIENAGSGNPQLGPQVTIPVASYTDPSFAPHFGNLYGYSGLMQTSGCSFDQGGTHIRNKQLYVAHASLMNSAGVGQYQTGDRVGIFWYRFDLTGDPTGQGKGTETPSTVPALVQSGVIVDPRNTTNPLYYYLPCIMTNVNGDMVITGTVSSAVNYINVFYTTKSFNSSTTAPIMLLTNNANSYNFGTLAFDNYPLPETGQRWGDYGSIFPDPVGDLNIWSTNEAVAFLNGWGVLATQFVANSDTICG